MSDIDILKNNPDECVRRSCSIKINFQIRLESAFFFCSLLTQLR